MTQDAGALLKLADELHIRIDPQRFAQENLVSRDLCERIEKALRQAASQGSAGGEQSEVRTADALRLLQEASCFGHEVCPSLPCHCAETLAALASAQAQTGCGDPSCKDPNCTYGSGPTEAQIERGRQAVRDEYGSKLCFWAEDGTRHCRIEADQLCMCAEIATHCLSAVIPSAQSNSGAE